MTPPLTTSVRLAGFVPAPSHAEDPRLIGFARVVVGNLVVIDGIALRRRDDGTTELRFPSRVDRRRVRHDVAAPVDGAARRAIEGAVLSSLTQLSSQEDSR